MVTQFLKICDLFENASLCLDKNRNDMNKFFKKNWAIIVFGGFFAILVIGTSLVYAQPVILWNNEPKDLTTTLLLSSMILYGWFAWRALHEAEFPTDEVIPENYVVEKQLRVARIKRVGKTA